MDKEVLKQELTQRFQRSLEEALLAVDQSPDGQWIAASEWQVRGIFQKPTPDCYASLIQQRTDQASSLSQAAFSPSGRSSPAKEQGKPGGSYSDGLR